MRSWNLSVHSQLNFTLAADARFSEIDPLDDQVWELSFRKGEPGSILLHTTFGLRAQAVQIFPRFIINDKTLSDPFVFSSPPVIKHILPNYISFDIKPSAEFSVFCEYRVIDSHAIAGRYTFNNLGKKVLNFSVELASILKPLAEGENMTPHTAGTTNLLVGKTHNLVPALLVGGEAQVCQSPFPALTRDVQIIPGKSRGFTWAMVSGNVLEASIKDAQRILDRPWEEELARIFMVHDSQELEIYTGDVQWDLVFSLAQNTAYSLLMGKEFPEAAFTLSRKPDNGYSFNQDSAGRSLTTQNRSAMDAMYLSSFLLPGGKAEMRKMLDNLLAKYDPDDKPDKTGAAVNMKKTRLDQPVLCSIAWEYYKTSADEDWLTLNFPRLVAFLHQWFNQENDKDQDGFPEWETISQSGLEESPTFDRWNPETQGLNIQTAEAPALAAMLYQECKSMINLSKGSKRDDLLPWLFNQLENLENCIGECWNEKENTCNYRDYLTHVSQRRKKLMDFSADGSYPDKKTFSKPQRLLLHIVGNDETRRRFKITISGKQNREPVSECIQFFDVSWLHGQAFYTTSQYFTRLDMLEVEGMNEKDRGSLYCADHFHQDISLLLPLWANAMSQSRSNRLIEKTIKNDYWSPYGIPICPQRKNGTFLANPAKVRLNWNHLVGEGLLKNHHQELAARLVTGIMQAVIINFNKLNGFAEQFHSQTAEPSGEINHLHGLPPFRLFLDTLGVQYKHKDQVIIQGNNPYPWPITVKFRGTSITRHKKDTVITFLSGQTITLSGPGPYEVNLVQQK